jgi:hypothetical protein
MCDPAKRPPGAFPSWWSGSAGLRRGRIPTLAGPTTVVESAPFAVPVDVGKGDPLRARLVIGVVLCLVGVVWVGQGVGLIGGSFMSGQAFWAVVGAVFILGGVGLLRGVVRMRGAGDHETGDRSA